MITLNKLTVYQSYRGDSDLFARAAQASEREVLKEADWNLIDILLQDAVVLMRQLGSDRRHAEAEKRLSESTESDEVIAKIRQLAEKL